VPAPGFVVRPAAEADIEPWLQLRHALWPHHSMAELRAEMPAMLADPAGLVLLACAPDGAVLGMAEANVRTDYVNGCTTSPVAFLEGIYVIPDARRRGVARALVGAVAGWASEKGLAELASDALLDNTVSRRMHAALGFAETERVVFFRVALAPPGAADSR
jgi:aminoglycoside 6'-N-acetyltransferase I